MSTPLPIHGRGAGSNPPNRFEPMEIVRDYDHDPELDPAPRTIFLRDRTQSIITTNTSPDIPYNVTINPYRGCEHGCMYCWNLQRWVRLGSDGETRRMVQRHRIVGRTT